MFFAAFMQKGIFEFELQLGTYVENIEANYPTHLPTTTLCMIWILLELSKKIAESNYISFTKVSCNVYFPKKSLGHLVWTPVLFILVKSGDFCLKL